MTCSFSLVHLLWGQDNVFWGTLVPSSGDRSRQEAGVLNSSQERRGALDRLSTSDVGMKMSCLVVGRACLGIFTLGFWSIMVTFYNTNVLFHIVSSYKLSFQNSYWRIVTFLKSHFKYFASFWGELFFKKSSPPHWGVYLTSSICCLQQLW